MQSEDTDDTTLAQLVESNCEPTRAQLAALMRCYLAGTVDDEMVERLHTQFSALVADPRKRRTEDSDFRANSPLY